LLTSSCNYVTGEIPESATTTSPAASVTKPLVYITIPDPNGPRVIDVSNPSIPKEVSTADLGGFAIALTLKDNLLYVTKSDKESLKLQISIVDITGPETPRLRDTVMTGSVFGFGGATFSYCFARPRVIGDYVYIAGGNYLDVVKSR
jgi:hypothetical protein